MNPLSLPLDENGIFQIDNSFLDSFQYCPASTEILHLKKRTLKGRASAALDFGSAGHLALDARYAGASDQQQCDLLVNYFAGIPESASPDADHRDLNFAIEVFVRKYGERYPIEPFNIMLDNHGNPIVERAFSVPFLLHSMTLSTPSLFPSSKASTRPSVKFRTQPNTEFFFAISCMLSRKYTP